MKFDIDKETAMKIVCALCMAESEGTYCASGFKTELLKKFKLNEFDCYNMPDD